MRTLLLFWSILVVFGTAHAQNPAPAKAQTGAVLILGGVAHLGNGEVIENSAIAFEQGKLTMVADATVIRLDRSKYSNIFDASGHHVYPDLIAMNSTLGLVELDAVRATNDTREVGEMNPSVRSIIAYNTDSDLIPTVRSNGVLLAQVVPSGGRLRGSSSLVQLDAWNWEDAALVTDQGMHLNWPQPNAPTRRDGPPEGDAAGGGENKYKTAADEIGRFFEEAKAYAQVKNQEPKLLKYEAMRPLFAGAATLYVHTDKAVCMRDAVLFAQKMGVKIVLVGGTESYMIADYLAKQQVPVVLGSTQSLPDADEHDYDMPYKTPALLSKAGVRFAITDAGSWRQRNLPFQAGQAVGFGLDKELALRSITEAPAQMLGVADRMGTIGVGKDATLIISTGDLLDMRTSNVIAAWIQGRQIDLNDKHKKLWKKFGEREK